MTITVEQHEFSGPFSSVDDLEDRAGVLLVICEGEEEYLAIDCGESRGVKTRVTSHERAPRWSEYSVALLFAVQYTQDLPEVGRMEIERVIRSAIPFPCGSQEPVPSGLGDRSIPVPSPG